MNVKALLLGIVVAVGAQSVWAAASPQGCTSSGGRAAGCVSAPEIDAAGGFNALALVGGVLMLISERRRRSHSKK